MSKKTDRLAAVAFYGKKSFFLRFEADSKFKFDSRCVIVGSAIFIVRSLSLKIYSVKRVNRVKNVQLDVYSSPPLDCVVFEYVFNYME